MKDNTNSLGEIKWLYNEFKMYKYKLLFAILLSITSAFFTLATYACLYFIIIEIINEVMDFDVIFKYTYFSIFFILSKNLTLYLSGVISHNVAYTVHYNLTHKVLDKFKKLYLSFFINNSVGSLKKVIIQDINKTENFIAHHILELSSAIFFPIFTICFLFFIDYKLAIISIVPLFISLFLQYKMIKIYKKNSSSYQSNIEKMNSVVIEYVNSMKLIKMYTKAAANFSKYKIFITKHHDIVNSWVDESSTLYTFFKLSLDLGLFFILSVGSFYLFYGDLKTEIFILFLILGISISEPIGKLISFGTSFNEVLLASKRIKDILQLDELEDKNNSIKLKNYNISFNNVSCKNEEREILKNSTFEVKQKKITAFIGKSGEGKTTAAQLLLRFNDIKEGEILIGGVNIKDINLNSLQKLISFVFQDSFLFNASVYENVAIAKENASKEEVIEACKIAQAHEFILKLQDSYDTKIGKNGISLSAGEKQRISIARAVLKDAPILILDEPSSSSDAKNEYLLQKALEKVIKNKTVIIISHNLLSIKNVNQIILFENKNIYKGTHVDLLKTSKEYELMYKNYEELKDWSIKRC